MRRQPLRIAKAYDTYEISFGNAGFAVVKRNGRRIMPHNKIIKVRVRRELSSKEKEGNGTNKD